jgi:hypothetical protein
MITLMTSRNLGGGREMISPEDITGQIERSPRTVVCLKHRLRTGHRPLFGCYITSWWVGD